VLKSIPTYYDAPDILKGSVPLRGDDQQTDWIFSYVSPESECRRTTHCGRSDA
jgi:hypothetical protein